MTTKDTQELMNIYDAAKLGIERLRKPIWANPMDHLQIAIYDGAPGPWAKLYFPFNKECNGKDPVQMLTIGDEWRAAVFVAYDGPLPDSDEYKAAVARFDGCMSGRAAS